MAFSGAPQSFEALSAHWQAAGTNDIVGTAFTDDNEMTLLALLPMESTRLSLIDLSQPSLDLLRPGGFEIRLGT
jgi:hypothetical protein